MNKQINVLVFPAGEINSVELHDALSTAVNIKVYGGSSVDRHGPYIFENYIGDLPFINDEAFLETFNAILDENAIDVIFPTHDSVATFLTENRDALHAKVVAADVATTDICRDKAKTYAHFSEQSFVPRVYHTKDEVQFPAFAKPKVGQGSVGAKLIEVPQELDGINLSEYIVAEYLPGNEYTVDCLTDMHGELRVISPRSRDRTLAGVSVAGRNRAVSPEIKDIANKLNDELAFSGLWFFQIKQDINGNFKLLEISTRCAGTMCLTRVLGANLPLLSVYVTMGYEIEPLLNNYEISVDRTLINRYKISYDYETVYLDFDDTVIVRDKVHLYAMMFIYQCRNQGKDIHLITKHADELDVSLKHYGIDKNLFASVIHLKEHEHKIDNITPDRAVFIDNSFQERKYVHDKFAIPVFDVDAIESLLDWRN